MASFVIHWWRSMGAWRWPNLLTLLCIVWFGLHYEAVPDGWVSHGKRQIGRHEMTLLTQGRIRPGRQLQARIETDTAISIEIAPRDSSQSKRLHLTSDRLAVVTDLPVPPNPRILELVATDIESGSQASWQLGSLYD